MAETATRPQPAAPVAPPKRFIIEAPLGYPIVWYPHGSLNEPGQAATCVQAPGRGLIALQARSKDGIVTNKHGVPHISDPRLILHPVRDPDHSKGAWGWVEGLVPEKYRDITDDELRIIQFYTGPEHNCGTIADLMGGTWTSQKVSGVLIKHRMLDKFTQADKDAKGG